MNRTAIKSGPGRTLQTWPEIPATRCAQVVYWG